MAHCIEILANKYPQLLMPIKKGISKSEEYKKIVLNGLPCLYKDTFSKNPLDNLETINTPAGEVEVLTLYEREDFVHAVRALGNKCEPVDVPDSTGAISIFGLNNWEKVRAGLDNYKDSFIILSSGNYSNVSNEDIKRATNNEVVLSQEEWVNKSILIRKYHELTHFVMRKKYPDNIKPLRDEIIADIAGLIEAFGYFDDRLLKLFLGIENDVYREGGRLQNYDGGTIENVPSIKESINHYKTLIKDFDCVEDIWENMDSIL